MHPGTFHPPQLDPILFQMVGRGVSNTYLLTLLMVTPYPHRAPITPFVEPIAPFWIVMTCMTHRDVAGLLRPAIRYRPATGL